MAVIRIPWGPPRRAAVSVVMVLLAATLVSCGHRSPQHPASTQGSSTTLPRADATVSVALGSMPVNFNPLTPAGADDATRAAMVNVWPSPFHVDPQYSVQADYTFVSSAELVSVNPQTIVYKIDPAAVWSDGVAINAEDFVYNWHAQSGDPAFTDVGGVPYSVVSTVGYSDIASVTGSDGGKTVTVVFRAPFSDWKSLFDPLVPAHVAMRVGWNTGFSTFDPAVEVSAGPFEIQAATGTRLVLVDNPHYWGTTPSLSEVDLVLSNDPSTYASDLSSGRLQVVQASAQVDLVQAIWYLKDVRHTLAPSADFEEMEFNERNPFLASVAVREAIAEYTDRNALIAAGPGQLALFLAGQLPALDDNHIFVPVQVDYKANSTSFDAPHPDAASHLLSAAGYVMGSDGFWHLGGSAGPVLALRYTVEQGDPVKSAVAETFQAQLKAAGIHVSIVADSPVQLTHDVLTGNFDIAEITRSASPFPSSFEGIYSTAGALSAGPSCPVCVTGPQPGNYLGYGDPAVNQLFVKAVDNPDPFDAAQDYNNLDVLLWNAMATLPLYEDVELVASSSTVTGVVPNLSQSTLLWGAVQWNRRPPPATSTTSSAAGFTTTSTTMSGPRNSGLPRSAPRSRGRRSPGSA